MLFKKVGISLFFLAAAIGLLSCTSTSLTTKTNIAQDTQVEGRPDLKAAYAALGQSGGKVFTLEPKSSTIRIYAFRGGSAGKLGHNHVLSAPLFAGFFHLPSSGATGARFDLEFLLEKLEIDNPANRSTLGMGFASVLSSSAIQDTRKHMLGAGNLQADRFPYVRVHSLQISGEAPKFAAKVRVEMHGQAREMWVPLNVEGLPDRLSASGSFVLRQTDFGVQPYSALGGLIAVQDEVVIEFLLVGT